MEHLARLCPCHYHHPYHMGQNGIAYFCIGKSGLVQFVEVSMNSGLFLSFVNLVTPRSLMSHTSLCASTVPVYIKSAWFTKLIPLKAYTDDICKFPQQEKRVSPTFMSLPITMGLFLKSVISPDMVIGQQCLYLKTKNTRMHVYLHINSLTLGKHFHFHPISGLP